MKWIDYASPHSVREAVDLLAGAGGRASMLAGGTDLLVVLRVGRSDADLVVDGDRLHLFLDHQKRQIFHVMLTAADLSAGATEQDLGG